uniref:Uncharacterized protein n=1 Tax=Anguilla anguilla TaxID=7936 RepID=A0A0E9RDP2_ANGAN
MCKARKLCGTHCPEGKHSKNITLCYVIPFSIQLPVIKINKNI